MRKAEEIVQVLSGDGSVAALGFAAELSGYLPWMKKIVDVAQRRLDGEKVPNEEKVFSLFEPHSGEIERFRRRGNGCVPTISCGNRGKYFVLKTLFRAHTHPIQGI